MHDPDNEKERILNTFENHIIRDHQIIFRADSPRVEVMTWGNKNGSSNCRIDYMLRNGSLAVYGDLGEAIYRWYGRTSLEWISGCNLGYFHGKCEASSEGDGASKGPRPKDWDGDDARSEIQEYVRENIKEDCIDSRYYQKNPEAKNELRRLLSACGEDQFGYHAYLRNSMPGIAINNDDWWEILPSMGEHIPIRIRMHLIGLKLAFGKEIGRYC